MFPTYSDWDIVYTTKGLAKKRAKTTLRYIAYLAAIIGIIRLRRSSSGRSMKDIIKGYVRQALLTGALVLQVAASKVSLLD
jgi:hypothetical protein